MDVVEDYEDGFFHDIWGGGGGGGGVGVEEVREGGCMASFSSLEASTRGGGRW